MEKEASNEGQGRRKRVQRATAAIVKEERRNEEIKENAERKNEKGPGMEGDDGKGRGKS